MKHLTNIRRSLTAGIILVALLLFNKLSVGLDVVHAQEELVVPTPGMVITQDVTFRPGEYYFPNGEGIVIAADNITVDGNGAVLVGPGRAGDPESFLGTAVTSTGHSNVVLKNLTAKGFQLGLKVTNGQNWTITGNNFSDNYTDPDFGWGDGPNFGAVMLVSVHRSAITNNRGERVWNGLHLRYSNENTIRDNYFSHCSNVCLKMWASSRNLIENNVMNYGIRVAPGEVHARDSTSVLIETGSNDNRFLYNDFTHGGDGVFIRPLNGYLSTGNYFEGNDASYAHNNAWECWSPGNIFIRNKGNYSSYGFWLGGSDHTVLISNEAAYNGTIKANAPEPFGNAGIAVVKGSSSHFIMAGNYIHDNKNVGVAIGYKPGYEAYHWIIQQNRIENNATYGIYMYDTRWVDLAGNVLTGNGQGAIYRGSNVSDIFEREATMDDKAPEAHATISARTVYVGEPVTFDASASSDPQGRELMFRWDLGDGDISESPLVTHTYVDPGFYRVGLTVNNGHLADLTWFDVYVTLKGTEVGTEGVDASSWQAKIPARTVEWVVDSSPPDRLGNPALRSGAAPNLDRGIVREVVVPEGSPTLSFDTYYQIEQGYDFGFVQVSTDGGHTFRSLANEHTTTQTANDAIQLVKDNVPGFTGESGGWRTETFDLSQYAGQTLLLAFRYVTDPGVDEPGWWVDNIRVGTQLISDGSTLDGWSPLVIEEESPYAHIKIDSDHRVVGNDSVRIESNAATGIWSYFAPDGTWDLSDKDYVALWISFAHEVVGGFNDPQPVIRLMTDDSNYLEYTPRVNYLNPSTVPYSEARDGWQWLQIPLSGNADWVRTSYGRPDISHVRSIEIATHGSSGRYKLWLDGLIFGTNPPEPQITPNIALNSEAQGYPSPEASYTFNGDWNLPEYDNLWAPLDGYTNNGKIWSNWNSGHRYDWYEVRFEYPREINKLVLDFVSFGSRLQPPRSFQVFYWQDGAWYEVENQDRSSSAPVEGTNTVTFDPVFTDKVRVRVENASSRKGRGTYVGISELELFNTRNIAGNSKGSSAGLGTPEPVVSSNLDPSWLPLDGSIKPSSTWKPDVGDNNPSYGVDFHRLKLFNRVTFYLSERGLPSEVRVQYWTGSSWADVAHPLWMSNRIVAGRNIVSFDTVRSRKIRIIFPNNSRPQLLELEVVNANLLAGREITPSASYTSPYDTLWGPLDGSYASSPRWTSWNSHNAQDWYAVDLGVEMVFSRVNLFFYNDNGGVQPPSDYRVQYWDGNSWVDVQETLRYPAQPSEGFNTVIFEPVRSRKVRVLGTNQNPVNFGVYIGLTEIELFRWE